ncbi:hypothetical protein MMPV_000041 [Pyropia vietnamensis]
MWTYLSTLFVNWFRLLVGRRQTRLLMVGLDGAGKTTILFKLKLGEVVHTIPTIGFNVETVEYKNITCTVWDVGGQDVIRPLWRYYFDGVDAVVFVVDSNDPSRLVEAAAELTSLMAEPQLLDAALLVYANKQDLPGAVSAAEMSQRLGLPTLRGRSWFLQSCVAIRGEGLYEGLDWLSAKLNAA